MTDEATEEQRAIARETMYGKWVKNDVVDILGELLKRPGFKMRWGDGKIEADYHLIPETPWHYSSVALELDCFTWAQVMFETVGKKLKKRFVPSGCQMCFKTVVRPPTLRALWALKELQEKEFDFPSKCGIEKRQFIGAPTAPYGGYHYARGVTEGWKQYDIVRAAVDAHPELGPDVSVILKRGCTEMELHCGPSDQWEITEEQLRIEKMINQHVIRNPNIHPMPPHIQLHTFRQWVEFAAMRGDETYLDFTGGIPLKRDYVTYHEREQPPDENNDAA